MKKEDAMPNFVKLEEDILKFWQDNKLFEKLMDKNKNGKIFRFLDGPITANNSMGIHHCWGRTLKDVYLKYKAMKGYSCDFINGFDAHGLPVELAVEKELGINSKKEILSYGLDNFVEKCLGRVDKYSSIITEQSKRLGQWMDWKHSYYTNTDENITSIWYFLKKCKENGWLVKASKPMQWCPRCGTSVSEHEMHGSYKDVEHIAVFFKCPIINENSVILVWTTTPWTLSSNVAVAVNPNNDYLEVKIKSDSRTVYIGAEAKKVLKDDIVEVLRTLKGSELVGKTYETCFNEFEIQNFEHKIVAWNDVSSTDGTGAVHIAPGCGVEDFELGKTLGLREICPIDENGVLTIEFGMLAGHKSGEVRDLVFEELEKRNKLYYTHKFKHSYPICWRCKEEIVFRLIDSWFIKVDEIRPRLEKAIENVEFEPAYLKKRMYDWLENMSDWNISRSRFYGIPLPIYECENCGEVTVVGSRQELAELSNSKQVNEIPHLHRPHIDEILITCPHCGKQVKRVPEVGDCWLDAGITSFSTKRYFTDRKFWEDHFPSEIVLEMREQIRLWFYSLLFMSVTLIDKSPFEKIVAYESIVQEDGSKFSKSGYMIKFDEFADKLGADTARYLFAGSPLTSTLRFGFNMGEDARRRLLGLWNAYTFYNTYACIDNPDVASFMPTEEDLDITDKWLLQITNNFIKKSDESYSRHLSFQVVTDFEELIDNLTNFYIRANRRRFWKSDDQRDKLTAYWCLYTSLKAIVKVMAPIIPFMAEHIWKGLVLQTEKKECESVMLADYPTCVTNSDYSKYVVDAEIAKQLITLGGRLRNENQLKVKQPLGKMFVISDNSEMLNAVSAFETVVKDELNIKNIVISDSIDEFNDYYLTVNFKTAGAVLKQNVQKLKNYLESLTPSQMKEIVAAYDNSSINIQPFGKLDTILFIKNSKPKEEFVVAKEGDLVVILDITLNDELIAEGILREIIRNAQILRKEADFSIDARILLNTKTGSELLNNIVNNNANKFKQELLISSLNEQNFVPDIEREVEVAGETITLSLKAIK